METDLAKDAEDTSVTWVVDHHVRADRVGQFEEWLQGVTKEVARFSGWKGVTVLRPSPASSNRDYVLVVRFASYEDLIGWESSTQRARWLDLLEPIVTAPPTTRSASGLETWFQIKGGDAMVPPPRRKMALLVLIAIYPLVVLVTAGFGAISNGHAFIGVPVHIGVDYLARGLLTSVTLVILMTWVVMPGLTRIAHRWLYPVR